MRDADPAFAAAWEPRLAASPCFRPPTEHEVDVAWEGYRSGDGAALCRAWREHADPIRARLPFPSSVVYPRLGLAPKALNAASFLLLVRAALEAGHRFRAGLTPAVSATIHADFPWLERRHEHVPPGDAPRLDFPPVFAAFVDVPDLDDARARWQLCTALNEVQQSAYSRSAATLFRLPELARHAEREEALAVHYLAAWSPACTRGLLRQALWVLDALNAAIFHWTAVHTAELLAWSAVEAVRHPERWRAFVAGMDTPQVLWPLDGRPSWRDTLA